MSEKNTLNSATPSQKKQLTRLGEDALDQDGFQLTKDEAQRAIENGDELQKRYQELVRELGQGRYADEERESDKDYPEGFSLLPLEDQIEMLEKLPFGLD